MGVSIGIERVFAIMEAQMRERSAASGKPIRATETEVLVSSIGNNMQVSGGGRGGGCMGRTYRRVEGREFCRFGGVGWGFVV